MESIKRTVIVTIEKEIEIELTPAVFGGMSEAEYLASFSKDIFAVESMDDIVKYAASMIANYGAGYEHDGIGLVGKGHSTYPRVPEVKFDELSSETEVVIQPS